MIAAVLTEIGKPLAIRTVALPRIEPDEVLIQTRACGICRTDLHIQDGLAYVPSLPHVPGHEPAGVVAEVGSEVRDIRVGQRVVPHLFVRSAECAYSRAGQDAQALHLTGILGVTLPGGFAEVFKAPARNLLVLPDEVPFEAGGLTSCAVITAVHAFRKAELASGQTALVFGGGGIGLILVQLLRAAGVRTAVVARSPESLELARQHGADFTAGARSAEMVREIVDFSGQDGVDCVFEMVGLADTMQTAARVTRRGGRIIVVGEEPQFPAIDTVQIAQRELAIIGSRNGGMQDAADALAMMAQGIIRPHIAARYPLADINEAFDAVRQGAIHGRAVVTIGG
ncbi:MAG: alcohol dehydrogenase catalytic domain-containing protein [Planctomycetia bacterium]|nr:alcohol dehydrogenase catalytic domain-containing protein [Planctomycetia bacterium]